METREKPRSRRLAALGLTVAGIAILAVAVPWPRKASDRDRGLAERARAQAAARGGLAIERESAGVLVDSPEEMRLPPARGRTLYFRAEDAPPHHDGSLARPWGGKLEPAFAKLVPGDRLVLLPGRYPGPVVVDAPARDGTQELPIEVWGRVDAILRGSGESPVVEVRRAYWTFYGLEIIPGESSRVGFMTSGSGAHHVVLDDAHIHGGAYGGVLVGPGSSNVTLVRNHLRGFAPPRLKPGQAPSAEELEKSAGFPTFGVGIAPGAEGVTLRANNLHNILGRLVWTFAPEEYARLAPISLPGDPSAKRAARGVVIEEGNALQENWAAGGDI